MKSTLVRNFLTAAAALATTALSIAFIFPTKDTQEESRLVAKRLQSSVYTLAYDDDKLLRGDPAALDDSDTLLMDEINPREGRKFTEGEVRRLKTLREKFPDNALIPRAKSPQDVRRDQIQDAALKEMADRFNAGRASRADVDGYFDYKKRLLNDWRQVLNYVVHEENWSPSVKGKYERMLQNTERMERTIESQRATMLLRNGFAQTAGN